MSGNLCADIALIEHWRRQLASNDAVFRIGIAWQGNPRQWDMHSSYADRLRLDFTGVL